jgi:Kef-type K+ transport system membrane component KefB
LIASGEHVTVLFGLALLVVAAKLGGLLTERRGLPAVLGELLIGIAVGNLLPLAFGSNPVTFVREQPTLQVLGEIGVLLLMFDVGLEADLRAFARVGVSACLVALLGLVTPFLLGWLAAAWMLPAADPLVHVFLGASLTATSVGITARVLKDLGLAQSVEGRTILGAAVLDDVLGLVVLAVVGGMVGAAAGGGPGVSSLAIAAILGKSLLFLAGAILAGIYLSRPIVRAVAWVGQRHLILVVGVAFCFTLAFLAEQLGLAGIVGAFAAGLLLDPYGEGVRPRDDETLAGLVHVLSSIFVPLFFVLMGIQVDLASLADASALGLGGILIVAAVLGKLACALGAGRGTNRIAVAVGMVPRGEVGLIFAGIGASLTLHGAPLISPSAYSALVVMVLVTTLLTPVGLRWALRKKVRRGPEKK